VDELGYLDVFSVLSEKMKDSLSIIAPTSRQQKSIISSHKNPMLSMVIAYKESQHYLSLIPEQGVVVLWNATFDDQCVEYIGHNDSIIDIACLPSFTYTAPKVESLDVKPRRGGDKVRRDSKDFTSIPLADENNNVDSSIALLASNAGLKGFGSENSLLSGRSESSMVSLKLGEDRGFATDLDVGGRTSLKICKEENIYFSCSADGIIRCWDEFLRAEMYQFKYDSADARESSTKRDTKAATSGKGKALAKGKSQPKVPLKKPPRQNYNDIYNSQHVEITCMMMLWDYNCIVTGSEDGVVCIWNADSGNKLISRALSQTVTALVTASTKKR